MKYYKALLASLLFVAILLCCYYLHVRFFRVNVVLYSAALDGVIAMVIAVAIVSVLSYFRVFSAFEKAQLAAIWLLLGYAFAISIPAVIDRSLSFYILEKLQQRGGGIQLARFEDVFTKEYLKEHHLVGIRLTEQQQSGTISIHDGCVRLTERGTELATFSRFFRTHLLPKHRLLMGQYTDELTDPFRHSVASPGYECR